MKSYYQLLLNTVIAMFTNTFTWFALTYWIYLETQSVLSTAFMGGTFMILMSLSGFWFGSIVDHNKKKTAIAISSTATLIFFSLALVLYLIAPEGAFTVVNSVWLWLMVVSVLLGATAGNIRNIALPTVTTLMVPEDERPKFNGMVGMIMGISFAGASLGSGLTLGFGGMLTVFVASLILTTLALIHLTFISIPEKEVVHTEHAEPKTIDLKGTIKIMRSIPGLLAMILFTTFNNFLGGVFMALMDAYGLTLVSVQVWGVMWGFLSLSFILGGMWIAKKGLGKDPVRNLFRINMILWAVTILFPLQPSIIALAFGMVIYMALVPFIEATEHTVLQKVVPYERQGRVFGFAQSVETAASPITAFLIGPIAQFVFIPFMTTGAGVGLIGDWFGVGPGRGIALVFICTAIIGLIVAMIAQHSRSYKLLTKRYQETPATTS